MASALAGMEPVRTTPLIRVGRWTMLTLGVLWGIQRHRSISKKEALYQEKRAAEKPAKDAAKAAEKARLNREELIYLAKETGTPIPPNF